MINNYSFLEKLTFKKYFSRSFTVTRTHIATDPTFEINQSHRMTPCVRPKILLSSSTAIVSQFGCSRLRLARMLSIPFRLLFQIVL